MAPTGAVISAQQPDSLQFRKVENLQDALGRRENVTFAKETEYPTYMDRSQSDSVSNVLLAQRKRVALFTDHISRRDARQQTQKQMSDAFFGGTLAQRGKKFGRIAIVGDAGIGDGGLNAGIDGAPRANFAACESAYLSVSQCLDRKLEPPFKDGHGGKEISRQQEFQDLPAAIGKLEVAESPARADYEHVFGHLISGGDLRATAGRKEMLPAWLPACLRVFRR